MTNEPLEEVTLSDPSGRQRDASGHFLPDPNRKPQAKRSPGRPKGSTNRAPSQASGTRPARESTRPDRPLTKSESEKVRAEIATALLGVNALLLWFLPGLALRSDGADFTETIKPQGSEIDSLTDALVTEVEASASLRLWMRRAGTVSPHLKLITAIGSIVVARLGLLLGTEQTQEGNAGGSTPAPGEEFGGPAFAPPARVAPGTAYGRSGNDGLGQVNADGSARAESAG